MKFAFTSIFAAVLVGFAAAQSVNIGAPADRTVVRAGSNITVEIDRPDTISSSIEVAVVIALTSCNNATCRPPTDFLGSILYNGPYNPQFQSFPSSKPPYQNFTVTVPDFIASGPAQLVVWHVLLLGASHGPTTEIKNITLLIE